MKITPEQYAKVLIAGMEQGNIKDIAKNFWYKLQRNNQHKDLSKILECLDSEYAKQNNKILVKVYSSKALDKDQTKEIEDKLTKQFKKELILKNIITPSQTAGIIVKADDIEIDLSLENKVNRLKNALNNNK
ncbi:MAG: F0F1 ATP synthase subunit delta [Patescibacteria group bacterium]